METEQKAVEVQTQSPPTQQHQPQPVVAIPAKHALQFVGEIATDAVLQERHEQHQRYVRFALLQTMPHDWIGMGKDPYLEGTGAERIARYYGLTLTEPIYNIETKPNGHVYIECAGYVRGGDREVFEIGDCASDDRFFERHGAPQHPEEVNKADVKKKARENWKSRAVASFFGLRGLKWPDLETLSGGRLNQNAAGASIEYERGKNGGSKQTSEQRNAQTQGHNAALEDYQNQMAIIEAALTMALSFGDTDENFAKQVSEYKGKSYNNMAELKQKCGEAFEKYKNTKLASGIASRAKAYAEKLKENENGKQ